MESGKGYHYISDSVAQEASANGANGANGPKRAKLGGGSLFFS